MKVQVKTYTFSLSGTQFWQYEFVLISQRLLSGSNTFLSLSTNLYELLFNSFGLSSNFDRIDYQKLTESGQTVKRHIYTQCYSISVYNQVSMTFPHTFQHAKPMFWKPPFGSFGFGRNLLDLATTVKIRIYMPRHFIWTCNQVSNQEPVTNWLGSQLWG